MLRYTLKRLLYGLLVLLGVVTLVFFLFNILPGDPARMMLGEHADAESIEIINRDLGRDKPVGLQYLNYLNDLLPVSVHNNSDPSNYFFLDPDKYAPYATLLTAGSATVVLKAPYLRRSYQTKRKVSDIISSAFPQTALLAVVALTFALLLGVLLGIVSPSTKTAGSTVLPSSSPPSACRSRPSSLPSSSLGSLPMSSPTGHTSICSATSTLSTTTVPASIST